MDGGQCRYFLIQTLADFTCKVGMRYPRASEATTTTILVSGKRNTTNLKTTRNATGDSVNQALVGQRPRTIGLWLVRDREPSIGQR
jgi:hypothetical protein